MENVTMSGPYKINFGTGKLEPIEVSSKSDLPRGTILHLHGYNEPDYVITGKIETDNRFGHGSIYEVIHLETGEYARKEASGLYWPAQGTRGIHTEITTRTMPENEIRELEANVENIKAAKEIQANQAAQEREREREQIKRAFPYLKQAEKGSKLWGPTLAATNIRIELKRAYPGFTFSVKTEKYSMGNSVNVSWTDGPTSEEVGKITNKYQGGSFDGMEDIYNYSHDVWNEIFGDTKYLFNNRHYSKEFVEKVSLAVGVPVVWNTYGGFEAAPGKDWEETRSRSHWLNKALAETKA